MIYMNIEYIFVQVQIYEMFFSSKRNVIFSADDLQKNKKQPRRSIDVMKSFMGDMLMKKEEAAERRHREKIDCVNALIGVLKDSLNKKDN